MDQEGDADEGVPRLMSLQDGLSKMSKSDPNDNSRINLLDPPDVIMRKIRRCKTDLERGLAWDAARPECCNLLSLYRAVSGLSRAQVMDRVSSMSWGEFKPQLAQSIIEHLTPIQQRYHALVKGGGGSGGDVDEVLRQGTAHARVIASEQLARVKQTMGFMPPPPHRPRLPS